MSEHVREKIFASLLHGMEKAQDPAGSLDEALQLLLAGVNADRGYFALAPKTSSRILPVAATGVCHEAIPDLPIGEDSLTGWSFQHQKVYRFPGGECDSLRRPYKDEQTPPAAEVVAPMRYNGQVLGFLLLTRSTGDPFSSEDVLFLQTIADEVALLYQNETFYRAAIEAAAVFFDLPRRAAIAEKLAETANRVMGAAVSSVWLLDPDRDNPTLARAAISTIQGTVPPSADLKLEEGGISWQAMARGREALARRKESPESPPGPIHVTVRDVTSDAGFHDLDLAKRYGLRSMISMPMMGTSDAMGVINCYACREYTFFDKEIVLLRSLALRGGLAIEIAGLLETSQTVHDRILEMAQLANPGLVALSISHDAKHTLQDINSFLSHLVIALPPDEQQSRATKQVVKSLQANTTYLRRLFSSLVAFARDREPDYEDVPLVALLEEVSYIFSIRLTKADIATVFSVEPENLTVEGDRDQLAQVFLNLFNNAIYAMTHGLRRGKSIQVIARPRDNEMVHIEFRDDGPGIPKEDWERVFEPSYSTKGRHGSGFGLAICQRIVVDNHGGTIRVGGRPGFGTSIVMALPRGAAQKRDEEIGRRR